MPLSLFDSLEKSPVCTPKKIGMLYCDGGSRGNPGKSAGGAVLYDSDKKKIESMGWFYGIQTNNFAEYSAVRDGLKMALNHHITDITVYLDSKLIVEQMNGRWKVKNKNIKPLHEVVFLLAQSFQSIQFFHVFREQNTEADALVNKKLDNS